jgi:hypothetical protein
MIVNKKQTPQIPKNDYDNISIYLINIMKACWIYNINNRPSIKQINESMAENFKSIE